MIYLYLFGTCFHFIYVFMIIGNNVGFGPGVKVLGKVTIGDNCFIAANAVVVKDMPANAIVGGVPAKIIKMIELK